MPTIAGLRRRGVTPGAIRDFCRRIGVTKQDNTIEMSLLEFCIRQDLETGAPRGMAVLDPLKVTLKNYPENRTKSSLRPGIPSARSSAGASCRSARRSSSSATTSWKIRRRTSNGCGRVG